MKQRKKCLGTITALIFLMSAVPVYAQDGVTELSPLMYDGLTLVSQIECDSDSGWAADIEGNSTASASGGIYIISKDDAGSKARAFVGYEPNIQGELYIEMKLAASGSSRVEVFSQKNLMTYIDFNAETGAILCNGGIKPNSHANQTIQNGYTANNSISIGLHMSAAKDTFDVYVDGTIKARNLPMRFMGDYEALSGIRFTSMNPGDITAVDHIRLYTINKRDSVAPTVDNFAIAGVVSYGRSVEAEYDFYDEDGDGEGESIYQWYRADSPDGEYLPIQGAVRNSYAVTAEDTGKYLKASVIPVDFQGNAGELTYSDFAEVVTEINTVYKSSFDEEDIWTPVVSGEHAIAELTSGDEDETYIRTGTTAKDSYGQMTKELNFTGDFTIAFDARVPELVNGANRTYLMRMTQKTAAGNKDIMQINYYDSSNGGVIRAITSDGNKQNPADLSDWHRIRIDVNMTSKTMTLYVDDTTQKAWENMPLCSAECTESDPVMSMTVGMTAANTTETADIRIKNIEILQIAKYNTAPSAGEASINGSPAVGSVIDVDYIYSDPEDDPEWGTEIGWYMSGSKDGEFMHIDGLSGKTITIPVDCAGAYIKAVIVPADIYGLTGEPSETDTVYVKYSESDSPIVIKPPREVSVSSGMVDADGGSYTFTADSAETNRWIFDCAPAFTAPAIMSFKITNRYSSDARICIPNTQFGYFEFKDGTFKYIGNSTTTIADSIDPNHTYDIRLVFAELAGEETDHAQLFVDGNYLGQVITRQTAVTSVAGFNVYTYAAGSLTISDFSVINILAEYSELKLISEELTPPGDAYRYSAVIRNNSDDFVNCVFVLALYNSDMSLAGFDVYDEGLASGDTSIELSVIPKDNEEYTVKVIKLDGFDTLKPLIIK